MANVQTDRLFDLVDRMPAFSATVSKIIALANDPHSSPTDLVKTVSMDPVLTAKLLKLINSAYYGLRQPVVSLQRAVIMLGFNTVKNIALSISAAATIKIRPNFKWFSRDQFWEHSLACAVASKAIARKAGVRALDVEEFFIAGLLHDIGKTLFIQVYTTDCEEIYDPAFEPEKRRVQVEKERFSISHDELGGVIAKHWKFPDSLVEAISGHHDPMTGSEEHLIHRQVTHIANTLCNQRNICINNEAFAGTISDHVWESFTLSPDEANASLGELETTLLNAKVFLQII